MNPINAVLPDCSRGPESFARFDTMVDDVLAVPSDTLERRERAYKKQSEAKAVRPGPKRKSRKKLRK